jgi:hypothetical protein
MAPMTAIMEPERAKNTESWEKIAQASDAATLIKAMPAWIRHSVLTNNQHSEAKSLVL